MHTRREGILATWNVPIAGKHYYRAFIWDTVENMREVFGLEDDTTGYAVSQPYAWLISGNGEIKLPKKFAELHLPIKNVGAGVVAHEIQHILNYWIEASELSIDKDDEEIATLSGEMTREYWNGYYRNLFE